MCYAENAPHLGHEAVFRFKKFDYLVLNQFGIKKDLVICLLSSKFYVKIVLNIKFFYLYYFYYGGPREALHHFIKKNLGFQCFILEGITGRII